MDVPEQFPSWFVKACAWCCFVALICSHGDFVAIWGSIPGVVNGERLTKGTMQLFRSKWLEVFFVFCFYFYGHTWGIWKFPGQGLNRSFCCLWPTLQPQQCWNWATSVTSTAACGKSRPLTHWARPGTAPASLQWQCCVLNPPSHSGNYLTRRIYGNIDRC